MDIFANAKTKAAPAVKLPKSGKDKDNIHMGKALSALVALDTLAKIIASHKESILADVKEEQMALFVDLGMESGLQPESFIGSTADASATMVFSKRSTNSPLSDEQRELLEKYGIPFDTKTVVESIDECFVINNALFDNPRAMKKFNDALVSAKLTEIDGEPILIKQEGREAVTAPVVADLTIPSLFRIAKEANLPEPVVRAIADAVTTPVVKSCKLKRGNGDLNAAFEVLVETGIDLTPVEEKPKAPAKPKAAPKK